MKQKNSEKKSARQGCMVIMMFVLLIGSFLFVDSIQRPARPIPTVAVLPSLTAVSTLALATNTAEAEAVSVAAAATNDTPAATSASGFVTMTPEARVTMIPQATGEAVMSNLDLIKTTLTMAQTPPILDVVVNDDIRRVQIVFTSGNTLAEIEQQMQTVFCAAAPVIPAGYDMRLGAKASNSITLATAVINANKMRPDSCVGNINWATFADEYNPASGLVAAPTVARAAPQQQQRRPDNCEEARAMGLSEREAAQWDHLDRDNDGVACYGD